MNAGRVVEGRRSGDSSSSPPPPGAVVAARLGLQCPNGYVSSLSIVREENAPALPVYHRRVLVPIDSLDSTGTVLPEKHAFYNTNRKLMVLERSSTDGLKQWTPHRLAPAVAREPKWGKCTFGVPRISAFGVGEIDKEPLTSCSRSARCCDGGSASSQSGSVPRGQSSPAVVNVNAVSILNNQRSPAMRKFLEPLMNNVRSANYFQKLITKPASPDLLALNDTLTNTMNGSLVRDPVTGTIVPSSLASTSQHQTFSSTMMTDSSAGGESMSGTRASQKKQLRIAAKAAVAEEQGAPSPINSSDPQHSKVVAKVMRKIMQDLNSAGFTRLEINEFDVKERKRREAEELNVLHPATPGSSIFAHSTTDAPKERTSR